MLRIIKNKVFYKHFFFSATSLLFLFLLWLKYLDFYTGHDDVIKVPNFNGVDIAKLDSLVDSYALRYQIIDSIFDQSRAKGVVVNQNPLAGTDVKKHRRIYLTINSLQTRKVVLPDIFDLTLRQAVVKLQKSGLEPGKLEYKSDIATNKVLAFKVNGMPIDIGQELYYGTIVDLVVGQGLSDEKVIVPNLIGLSRIEANIILKSTSLNIGLEYFNKEVIDSNSAVIYKQFPKALDNKKISIGSVMDLYFGLQTKKPL
tara:strand:+ start:3411 stop:4181 length:771 start_codon:yes stop_codon:yes gene_type:complete